MDMLGEHRQLLIGRPVGSRRQLAVRQARRAQLFGQVFHRLILADQPFARIETLQQAERIVDGAEIGQIT
jgi:hypothetical protein